MSATITSLISLCGPSDISKLPFPTSGTGTPPAPTKHADRTNFGIMVLGSLSNALLDITVRDAPVSAVKINSIPLTVP
ncbi:hypothetical protein DPMN_038154 [Dreissena polymorpha]|uniref:Uncharacterized protein n=1 Tax=Dreissena polymorpha TaxID=45954 RepID=A0A9D4MC83_DREPO|nr:hypothetical protein DPMN_038154 [Dreissena polymorpha]